MKKKVTNLNTRSPIVTVMGHVDHGKTTLIDRLRSSDIAGKEKGGITQSVRAFSVKYKNDKITFIDTPGHEAFSKMRERGSKITDIILLVVAADDGVKPQTKEVIDLALENKIPMVVAINKIDLPNINLNKVKMELANAGVLLEGFGGNVVCAEISAKTGDGIDNLLEMLDLVAQLEDIKFDNKDSFATVLESSMQKNIGPESLIVIQSGIFSVGDFVAGETLYGKIRAIIDDKGERIKEASASMPVRLIGLEKVVSTGEVIYSYKSKAEYESNKKIKEKEELSVVSEEEPTDSALSILDQLLKDSKDEVKKPKLNIILKTDVAGSLEAIEEMLNSKVSKEIEMKIIKSSTGEINESDIDLAKSTRAIILGFNIKVSSRIKTLAERERVNVMTYDIIYELVDDLVYASESLIPPEIEEIFIGSATVSEVFTLSNGSHIAGSMVKEGKIQKHSKCFIERDKERVYDGKISSIRFHKDEIKEAAKGSECGISVDPDFEFQKGDKITSIRIEKG